MKVSNLNPNVFSAGLRDSAFLQAPCDVQVEHGIKNIRLVRLLPQYWPKASRGQ